MKPSWRTEAPALALVLLMFALSAWAWPAVPERVPTHWGLDGRPDDWGSRAAGLLITPLVGVGLYLLFLVLPRLDPGRANYERFAGPYLTFRLATLGFVAAMHVATLAVYFGRAPSPVLFAMPLGGVALIVAGNMMGKIRPNWFFGVRTPWTLSSKHSWNRTHRAAGWVLIAGGLLFVIAGVVQHAWAVGIALGALALGLVGVIVYSYFEWKADPDKLPPAGTSPANDVAP